MITVQPVALPPPSSKKGKGPITKILLFIILILAAIAFVICYYGTPERHQKVSHPLYTSFDTSPTHSKLIKDIQKNKYTIVSGKMEDGLENFLEHVANRLTKNDRPVFVEDFNSTDSNPVEDIAQNLHNQIMGVAGQLQTNSDWIILSEDQDQALPGFIAQLQQDYPNSKIIIFTTAKKLKIKGFKSLTFNKIDGKILTKTMTKAYGIKPNIVTILTDYHDNHQDLFEGLEVEKFDAKEFLGDEFVTFEQLKKDEAKILKDLCQKGSIMSKKKQAQPQGLYQYGVIFNKNTLRWANKEKILNYELYSGVNCKNVFASEKDMNQYIERKKKELQEKAAQQEENRRKEEEKKAAEQQKALQEQQKKQSQSKKDKKIKKEEKVVKKEEKAGKKEVKPAKKEKAAEPKKQSKSKKK